MKRVVDLIIAALESGDEFLGAVLDDWLDTSAATVAQ